MSRQQKRARKVKQREKSKRAARARRQTKVQTRVELKRSRQAAAPRYEEGEFALAQEWFPEFRAIRSAQDRTEFLLRKVKESGEDLSPESLDGVIDEFEYARFQQKRPATEEEYQRVLDAYRSKSGAERIAFLKALEEGEDPDLDFEAEHLLDFIAKEVQASAQDPALRALLADVDRDYGECGPAIERAGFSDLAAQWMEIAQVVDHSMGRVCANCGHLRSLHVPPREATASRHGCMHEDVANRDGGAGDWCTCEEYRGAIRPVYAGYFNAHDVPQSEIFAGSVASTER